MIALGASARTRPGAYVTDGERLYQVIRLIGLTVVLLEDCSDSTRHREQVRDVCSARWRLVEPQA